MSLGLRTAVAAFVGGGLLLVASACAEAPDAEGLDPAADTLRLGRVHVIVSPIADGAIAPDDDAGPEALEVSARFAFVQGLDEDFVRARVDMPMLPIDVMSPAQCSTDEMLNVEVDEPEIDAHSALVLVDAGELGVQIGRQQFDLSLSLMPDLLPYMSGVEYVYDGEPTLERALPVIVDAAGTQADLGTEDTIPSFHVEGRLPAPPQLEFDEAHRRHLNRGALVLYWGASAPQDRVPLALRFSGMRGDEPTGETVVCAFEDRGAARIDLGYLHTLGLSQSADTLRVEAARTSVQTFDAGRFVGSELVVERRSRLDIPL